jgi:hypothetical protein
MSMWNEWERGYGQFRCTICKAPCRHDPGLGVVREQKCFEHASEQEQQRRTSWVRQTRMNVDDG